MMTSIYSILKNLIKKWMFERVWFLGHSQPKSREKSGEKKGIEGGREGWEVMKTN